MAKTVNKLFSLQEIQQKFVKFSFKTKKNIDKMLIDITIEQFPKDWCEQYWGEWYLWPSRSWRSKHIFKSSFVNTVEAQVFYASARGKFQDYLSVFEKHVNSIP